MDSTFLFEVLTPEHQFFSGEVEALTFQASDGEWTILKDHAPMIAVLRAGVLKIKQSGKWQEFINSEGYMEVAADGVVLFCQTCEWPDEVDVSRARRAEALAEERMRQAKSQSEFKSNQIMLYRAMARLRNAKKRIN